MDFQGKRILLTGDSHMDWSAFGNSLERLLKARGAVVTRLAIGATYAKQWLGDKDLCRPLMLGQTWRGVTYSATESRKKCINPKELETSGPFDLAVICTMGNDAATAKVSPAGNGPEAYVQRIKDLVKRSGAPNFLLVGAPYFGPDKVGDIPFIEAAQAAFGPRNFYNSKEITKPYWGKPGEGDLVHYTGTGGKKWAEAVVDFLAASGFNGGAAGGGSGKGLKIALAALGTVGVLGALWWFSRRRAAAPAALPPKAG